MSARPTSSQAGNASDASWSNVRRLSPRRKSTEAHDVAGLVAEQLAHFGIDAAGEYGKTLADVARRLYESEADIQRLWRITAETLSGLDRRDRIAYFNAKKFLSFQLAKLLDCRTRRVAVTRSSTTVRRRSPPRGRMPCSTTSRPFFRPRP